VDREHDIAVDRETGGQDGGIIPQWGDESVPAVSAVRGGLHVCLGAGGAWTRTVQRR